MESVMRVKLRNTHKHRDKGHKKLYMKFDEQTQAVVPPKPKWDRKHRARFEKRGGGMNTREE